MEFSVIAAMLASTVAGGVVASVCGFGFGVVVMAIWGVMGVVCMKVVVPALDEHLMPLVATVPMATKVLVAVLVVDIVLTIVAENCWSLRMEGVLPETPVQKAFALLFSDEFMARRFASMWQIAA